MLRIILVLIVVGVLLVGGAYLLGGPSGQPEPDEVASADPGTLRTTESGDVVGYTSRSGAQVWKGIPFAEAPVGDLRWRAPRPAVAWEGTREALQFGPRCPQITNALDQGEGLAPGTLMGSEDCLTLDIYAPKGAAAAAPLPVMVWIHGGGNVWGRAGQYDGGNLAVDQNVLVVTIQYRLGPLGWFAHEALRATAETREDRSANFGTLDMIAALEWVRDNIEAFGGDPRRVTVFGESAGGRNVASLMASPQAAGLFHRAILQSGSFASVPLSEAEGLSGDHPNAARSMVRAMVQKAQGADADPDDLSEEDLAGLLRDQDVAAVFAPYQEGQAGLLYAPTIIDDAVVVPADGVIEATGTPGGFNAVPVISGTTRDETRLFNFLNPDYVNNLFFVFFWAKDPVLYDVIADYQSLMWRVQSVDNALSRMRAAGHEAVYGYRFDWDEQGRFLTTDFSKLFGAAHGLEIPFVFNRYRFFGQGDRFFFTESNAAGRETVSKAMRDYWGRFAHTGVPGQGTDGVLPEWSPFGEGRLMVFDTPADGGTRVIDSLETVEDALDRLAADDRLSTEAQRCQVLDAVIAWYPQLAGYRAYFLDGACPA